METKTKLKTIGVNFLANTDFSSRVESLDDGTLQGEKSTVYHCGYGYKGDDTNSPSLLKVKLTGKVEERRIDRAAPSRNINSAMIHYCAGHDRCGNVMTVPVPT